MVIPDHGTIMKQEPARKSDVWNDENNASFDAYLTSKVAHQDEQEYDNTYSHTMEQRREGNT